MAESKKTSKKSTKKKSPKPSSKKVTIYSTKTCPFCQKTKEFLKENNIKFTNKDVSSKKNAEEMRKKSGQSGVPVIVVGDEVIVGFDKSKLKKALRI